MRAPWIVGIIAVGAVSVGGLIGGCMIVTGGTDGFALVDAGQPEATAPCKHRGDGGSCFLTECTTAADCNGGGATAQVCCLGLWSPTTVGFACQSSCPVGTVQACGGNAECGSDRCIHQACTIGPDEYDLQACGLVPRCSEIVSTPGEAGPPDANSPHDAATPDAGTPDTGTPDTGTRDAGITDANIPDAQPDGPG